MSKGKGGEDKNCFAHPRTQGGRRMEGAEVVEHRTHTTGKNLHFKMNPINKETRYTGNYIYIFFLLFFLLFTFISFIFFLLLLLLHPQLLILLLLLLLLLLLHLFPISFFFSFYFFFFPFLLLLFISFYSSPIFSFLLF